MKVYNEKPQIINSNLIKTLDYLRKMRGFNVSEYVSAKTKILNDYMIKSKLSACVVAVSGGIDSAVVLSLVVEASKQVNSPIKKIIAISLPALKNNVATNQEEAIQKAEKLCHMLNVELKICNINESFEKISNQIESSLNQVDCDNWARGQLVAYSRTPFIYYTTSVLSSMGFGAIVCGTTNRDEGAYLGYVGKASDGMVDVQLISDLHKSEVYSIAKYLSVPSEILSAIPNGDMYDGRIDEDVFGAPYDFVEMYLNYKNLSIQTWKSISLFWNDSDYLQFKNYSEALEKLHKYNEHKYWSGSQAVHLDVLDSAVNGGWIEGVHSTLYKSSLANRIVPTHKFVGFSENNNILNEFNCDFKKKIINEKVQIVENLLTKKDIDDLLVWKTLNNNRMIKTNELGLVKNVKYGSNRLSFYSENFAKILSEKLLLSNTVKNLNILNKNSYTNTIDFNIWRFIGVNPMIRLINYSNGDVLFPHYDDSFYENNKRRSLFSLIICLNKCDVGGATRFLFDEQDKRIFELRNFNDWNKEPIDKDIKNIYNLNPGDALIFPHRLLHDGEKVLKGEKIILRTELMFEACSPNLMGG